MSRLRVLLADDHPVVRSGLRAMIDALPDMVVVGEAADGASAVEATVQTCPNVVIMDIAMPGMNGIEATRELRRRCPAARVVALTAYEDRGYLQLLLAAGASRFVLKRSATQDLVEAVRDAAADATHRDPPVAGQAVGAPPDDPSPVDTLGDREVDVLRLVAEGLLDREIAERLQLDAAEVARHKQAGMAKIGVKTRAGVVRHAARQRWRPDP